MEFADEPLFCYRIKKLHLVNLNLNLEKPNLERDWGKDQRLRGCLAPPKKNFNPSHRMFGHMHGVLNVDKKITNYIGYNKFARRIF
jgi:hypothetical protein